MDEQQISIIKDNLAPLINESFVKLGFSTDDGVRYFRRRNNLVHYIVFSLEELFKENHGTRVDGNHLTYAFGEFLLHTPDLKIMSSSGLKVPVCCGVTNPIAFLNKKHFKNAADKVIKALIQLDTDRFSQVSTEKEYEDFHLRGGPSLEKIYHLASEDRHEEVDAWLKLLMNKHRGYRATKSYEDDATLQYYLDEPDAYEVSFSKLSESERISFINNLQSSNINANSLEFLYEAV